MHPAYAREPIIPRKKAELVRRETDRLLITIDRLIAKADLHPDNVLHASARKARDRQKISCDRLRARLLAPQFWKIVLGGTAALHAFTGVGGGTFLG